MATRVIFSGRVTSLPAWSVIVRVDEVVASWVVCSGWAVVEPVPPAQAVRGQGGGGQDGGQGGEMGLHRVLSCVVDYEGNATQN